MVSYYVSSASDESLPNFMGRTSTADGELMGWGQQQVDGELVRFIMASGVDHCDAS